MVVDVGGESTRPGAQPVGEAEELRRIVPVISALAEDDTVLVSVDTRHSRVAAAALEAGAHLVNDISGLRDPAMMAVCASVGVPVVIMHMQGEPATMQADPCYDDVVSEVAAFLDERAHAALAAGVPSVLIDPGIGFGKTLEHQSRAAARVLVHGRRLPGTGQRFAQAVDWLDRERRARCRPRQEGTGFLRRSGC